MVETGERMADELREALAAVVNGSRTTNPHLPEWLRELFGETAAFASATSPSIPAAALFCGQKGRTRLRMKRIISLTRTTRKRSTGRSSLGGHCDQVAAIAEILARACVGEHVARIAQAAGHWHDTGKLDSRFQDVLRGGAPGDGGEPLAKSPRKFRSREQANAIREAAGLPDGFRHEMLSAQLAEKFCDTPFSTEESELLLHLIASHHGHARPFAPVCEDDVPSSVNARLSEKTFDLSAEQRRTLIPPHRLDSDVTDRFWALIRRYGWWGCLP